MSQVVEEGFFHPFMISIVNAHIVHMVARQDKKLNLVDFILALGEKLVEKGGTEFAAEQNHNDHEHHSCHQ